MPEITRQQIEDSARKLIGAPWVHQGRDPVAGVDCLGVLILVGHDVGYLNDFHYDVYVREPDGETLLSELRKELDEIPVDDAREGDILVFRMAGERVPRHVGIIVRGLREYGLIHSLSETTVKEDPLRRWNKYRTNAFRFRGLVD